MKRIMIAVAITLLADRGFAADTLTCTVKKKHNGIETVTFQGRVVALDDILVVDDEGAVTLKSESKLSADDRQKLIIFANYVPKTAIVFVVDPQTGDQAFGRGMAGLVKTDKSIAIACFF